MKSRIIVVVTFIAALSSMVASCDKSFLLPTLTGTFGIPFKLHAKQSIVIKSIGNQENKNDSIVLTAKNLSSWIANGIVPPNSIATIQIQKGDTSMVRELFIGQYPREQKQDSVTVVLKNKSYNIYLQKLHFGKERDNISEIEAVDMLVTIVSGK